RRPEPPSVPTRRSSDRKVEQPRVVAVQDTTLAVVELSKEQHESLSHEGNVGGGQDERLLLVVQARAELVEELFRVLQVFDDVERSEEHTSELQSRENLV